MCEGKSAMRAFAVLLLAAIALQAWASAVKMDVEQLEKLLTSSHGESDSQVADQLSGLELTERLSEVRLARLEAGLPGPKSRERLTLLADASAFLNLPAAELPDRPKPDYAEQVRLLGLARNYVANTILKLPNFFATRVTTNYVSTLADIRINSVDTVPYKPFEEVDASHVTVLYRDGRELAANGDRYRASTKEVRTRGEFGPILIVVLDDAIKGHLAWSHWERSNAGVLAVFQYEVPEPASHYLVDSPGLNQEVQYHPAYHGEIALNPADGSILRLTIIPEMKAGDPMSSADLMVDYGPVEIGGVKYNCPIRSVALSQVRVVKREWDDEWRRMENSSLGSPQIYLNEVNFTRYHLFRVESRILAGKESEEAVERAAIAVAPPPPAAQPSPAETEASCTTSLPEGGWRFSVGDLEQGIAHDKTYGTSDADIAQHLSKVRLTERLSDARLAHLETELPSPIDREALQALFDVSAFLDLPEAEIPTRPAPDKAAQGAMLAKAMGYVHQTMPGLPDISASERVTCFGDRSSNDKTSDESLHKVGAFHVTLLRINGQEFSKGREKEPTARACGLADAGPEVFGPALAAILTDASRSAIDWSHWEQDGSEFHGVFAYSVPQESSHYPFSAQLNEVSRRGSARLPDPQLNPAYHGEIALNPRDGSILRITVVAEMNPDGPVSVANTLVEYAPVEMDGARSLWPRRSATLYGLRFSGDHAAGAEQKPAGRASWLYVDDAAFSKYRHTSSGKHPGAN